jgi:hypothetical protein
MCTGREFEMNVQQLRQKFESMSLDDLTLVIDEYEDGGWKQAVLNDVIDAKIKAMVAETKDGKLPPTETEETGDATLCPPAINSPSPAAFESAVPRDSNSTEKHADSIPVNCKPSPAPRWIPDHVPAVPAADVVGAAPINSDGTQANTFVGEVVPGLTFANPGRQEGKAIRIPLASEIQKGE